LLSCNIFRILWSNY